jgi:hypothetical protein
VSTFADFVVHVPTSCALSAVVVEIKHVLAASIDRNEDGAMAMAIVKALRIEVLNFKVEWTSIFLDQSAVRLICTLTVHKFNKTT